MVMVWGGLHPAVDGGGGEWFLRSQFSVPRQGMALNAGANLKPLSCVVKTVIVEVLISRIFIELLYNHLLRDEDNVRSLTFHL